MSLLNSLYFIGERDIPNTQTATVASALDTFIRKYEREFLIKLLGYELFKLFTTGIQELIPDQRYLDLLFGKEFTGPDGLLTKCDGLISITDEQPTISVDISSGEIFFTVGVSAGAPANGDASYINPDLSGKNFRVTQRSFGPLEMLKDDDSNIETADIRKDAEGFTWLNGVKFSQADKYIVTVTTAPLDITGVEIVPIQQSPIADYVYYKWMQFNATQTSGIGETKPAAQNAIMVSCLDKMVRAWNDMVIKNRTLNDFLTMNQSVYPEYVIPSCYEDYSELFHFKNSLM